MPVDILKNKRAKVQDNLMALRKQHQEISNKILDLVSEEKELNNTLHSKTLKESDIEKLLEVFPETEVKTKLRNSFLSQYGLKSDGYFHETRQMAITITLYKNDNALTEKTRDGILIVLPFIKPHLDGSKRFSIFESTLSLNGPFYLIVTPDGDYEVKRKLETFYSSKYLLDTLKYIQNYVHYE